ncbi:hypothetical protein F5884DRAFT_854236 [Xylogone sp. PMI_703]|nr:hypothetical protein F5884DRAFT_854236 [Xylogone sp. PMI_703]
MKFSLFVAAAFSALALGSPTAASAEKRDTRHVFITTGTNWSGASQNVEVENNVTYRWNDKVVWEHGWFGPGSMGPDPGVFCILYDQNGSPSGTISNPGLADVGSYWLDHTQQFKCFW